MIVKPWRELTYGQLRVKVFENALELGLAAAHLTSETIAACLLSKTICDSCFLPERRSLPS